MNQSRWVSRCGSLKADWNKWVLRCFGMNPGPGWTNEEGREFQFVGGANWNEPESEESLLRGTCRRVWSQCIDRSIRIKFDKIWRRITIVTVVTKTAEVDVCIRNCRWFCLSRKRGFTGRMSSCRLNTSVKAQGQCCFVVMMMVIGFNSDSASLN